MRFLPLALAAPFLLAGCTSRPAPAPAPAPRPVSAAPAPAAAPVVHSGWRYRRDGAQSEAAYGLGGAAAELVVRCDAGARGVTLSRLGTGAGPLTIATSYAAAGFPAQAVAGRTTATLNAGDPTLDRVAFSRGRWTVKVAGLADLEVPAWAEPARVIEDCRAPVK